MSLDPTERLAALRREIDAETLAVATPPDSVASDAVQVGESGPRREPERELPPDPERELPPDPERELPPDPKPKPRPPDTLRASEPTVAESPSADPPTPADDGWGLQELLADTSLSTWLGVGLLAVGGYLVVSWFVPGIDLIGSIIILAAGIVLLAQHFMRGAGAWALYAGAVLTGMGAARIIGDILPGSPHGLTAIGVGVAFLAISYLRHSQAGGYGWQGILGTAAVGLGLAQFVLGLLPGSPGVVDLILPAFLLIGGGFLVVRSRRPDRHS